MTAIYEKHRDSRFADLEIRFPLSQATAEGLKSIDAEKRAIASEPRKRPWMSIEQNARFWATALYGGRYYRAMTVTQQEIAQ